jgi:hypothetical protein
MSSVAEIEKAIQRLSEDELRELRAWFVEQDAKTWDQKFENDVMSGKLDALGAEALAEFGTGRSTPR